MKKKMLATTLLTGLLAACSGNSASVTGVWIEPIPGMEDQVQGIKLEEGGIASSVNMATLVYKNWKQSFHYMQPIALSTKLLPTFSFS